MLKRILFAMTMVLVLPVFCYGALPYWRNTQTYSTPYWKMNTGTKQYKVLFFEPTTWESASLKNQDGTSKFPLTIDGSEWTKTQVISNIIRPAVESYNNYNTGITFTYAGDADGDNSTTRYPSNESIGGYSYVMICYGSGGYAMSMGNAVYFKTEILMGSQNGLGNSSSWLKMVNSEELVHDMGFEHLKVGSNPSIAANKFPFYLGTDGIGNVPQSPDMRGGLDVVYGYNSPVKVFGHVNSSLISNGYAEAYLAFLDTDGVYKLYHQMPLDTAGYYEFRMPIPANYTTAKVIVFTSKFNKDYDGTAMPYKVGQVFYISNTQPGNYALSDITLDSNTSGTLQQIQDATNIKMVY